MDDRASVSLEVPLPSPASPEPPEPPQCRALPPMPSSPHAADPANEPSILNGYVPHAAMTDDAMPISPTPNEFPRSLAYCLYTSHFLSTWNSRLFEFGATLFLASIFPGTLMPMSVYALVRSGAAILFAQAVGVFIDQGNRLAVVRTSIIGQRLAVAASCALFLVLEMRVLGGEDSQTERGLFSVLVLLACVEKLCSMMNLISVERDWVVVITEDDEATRKVLNARMRRIDLLCKLLAPLAISFIAAASVLVAIWTTLGMSVASVAAEYICIALVYKKVPSLRRRQPETTQTLHESTAQTTRRSTATQQTAAWLRKTSLNMLPISSLPMYLEHPAFLPSFSLALLYLTVLSFSGQMVTYLIAIGYTSLHVGLARTVSTIFELSATWIAPQVMKRIGTIRGGIWSLSWQMIWLGAGLGWFFGDVQGLGTNSVASATGLAAAVALSRVGLWGYDLCAQNIVQDEVDEMSRGAFSTVEAAFQNVFELLSYAMTVVFSRPDQFHWPVAISVVAVYAAGGLYASFVRRRRGHLFHPPPCVCYEKHDAPA